MRLFLGIILGAAITVGGAYVRDRLIADPVAVGAKPMVNWDVVSSSVAYWKARAESEWARLSANRPN